MFRNGFYHISQHIRFRRRDTKSPNKNAGPHEPCILPSTFNLLQLEAPSSDLKPVKYPQGKSAANFTGLRSLAFPSSIIQAKRSSLFPRFRSSDLRPLISDLCPLTSGFSIVPHPSAAVVPLPSAFPLVSFASSEALLHRPKALPLPAQLNILKIWSAANFTGLKPQT